MEQAFTVHDVLAAMERRELKAYYQPKYDATTSRLKAAEALVRWVREDGSVILPADFLPVLEQTDAIVALDWYMVEEVCAFLESLSLEGIKARQVSVNFSRWHLHEPDFVEKLTAIVDAHHLERRLIVVEITESAMVHEEGLIRDMVTKLHEVGFEFSIDDFGSGLSNFSMVADTLADEIKIDRSLLKKNCEDERERWKNTFSRENQLRLYAEGQKELHLVTRQIGDDGVYRKVETGNYFVKSPASDDVLVISLCSNLCES